MSEDPPTLEVFKRIAENIAEFRKEHKQPDYTLVD